jgi:putative ABC transport system permease protein
MTTILVIVAVVSAVISAVGFVSTMSMTVIQREREIGLLRTLGFTRRQVRTMIAQESAALSGSAVLLGIALGLIYGSVGAQALIGSQTSGFVWGVPWKVLAVIALGAVVLVLSAALPPSRRAVRVTPVEALRSW